MYNMLQSGAKAVKMGTRFVTTTECDVSEKFKQNYIDCSKEDIVLIDSPVGLPGRVIVNDFVREIQQGAQKPVRCPWKCLKTCDYKKVQFCVSEALFNAARGDFSHGFSFAGTNAYKAKAIISVRETIDQLKEEYYREEIRFQPVEVSAC
jgi:nitronate monooxygenase